MGVGRRGWRGVGLVAALVMCAGVASAPGLAAPLVVLANVPTNERMGMVWVNCQRDEQAASGFTSCQTAGHPPSSLETRASQARTLGAGWNRWAMYWPDVQPNAIPGVYNWSYPDSVVDRNARAGLQSAPVLLNTPPGWGTVAYSPNGEREIATAAGQPPRLGERRELLVPRPTDRLPESHCSSADIQTTPPQGLYLPHTDPGNRFGAFVFAAVQRYKDRVRVWEIGNEPDLLDGNGCGAFWNGTRADYRRFLEVGYLSVKRADPTATVLMAGLAFFSQPDYFAWLLDNGAAPYFDVVPYHFYSNPYNVWDQTRAAYGHLARRGIGGKSVWINESNIANCARYGCPGPFRGNDVEQAAYQVQAAALAFAAGAGQYYGFQLYDDGNEEDFGYVRNDGALRPSYTAYQVAAKYLRGPTAVSRLTQGSAERILFEGTPQGRVWVLWNNTGTAIGTTVPATRGSAQLIDVFGNISTITPSGGSYTVGLAGRTSPDVPGLPSLLVESTTVGPCLGSLTPSGSGPFGSFRLFFPTLFRGCAGGW